MDGVPNGGVPVNYEDDPPLWYFDPDDPFIGEASLSCSDNSYMAQYVTMSVSGQTCTATDTSSRPTINVISSLAVTDDPHYALVAVEAFAKDHLATCNVKVSLTRVTPSGRKRSIDLGKDELVVGVPQLVTVPLDPATAKLIAAGKQVKMRAVIGRDDGGDGKGDTKTLVVREYKKGDVLP